MGKSKTKKMKTDGYGNPLTEQQLAAQEAETERKRGRRGSGARQVVLDLLRKNKKAKLSDTEIYIKMDDEIVGHGWPFVRISHMRQLLNREEFADDPIPNFFDGKPVERVKRGMQPPPHAVGQQVRDYEPPLSATGPGPIQILKDMKKSKADAPPKVEVEGADATTESKKSKSKAKKAKKAKS